LKIANIFGIKNDTVLILVSDINPSPVRMCQTARKLCTT